MLRVVPYPGAQTDSPVRLAGVLSTACFGHHSPPAFGIFCATPPQIRIKDFCHIGVIALLDTQQNRHALLDVKDILVLLSFRNSLLDDATSVQIEKVERVETVHQTLPHAAKVGAVEKPVADDIADNTFTSLFDFPLRPADKLHVIRLKRALCLQTLTINFFVIFNKPSDKGELPLNTTWVR